MAVYSRLLSTRPLDSFSFEGIEFGEIYMTPVWGVCGVGGGVVAVADLFLCWFVFHGFFLLRFVSMINVIYVLQMMQSHDYTCAMMWSSSRIETPPPFLTNDGGALCAINYLLSDYG